ncbi:MAG: ABC transporter permease [Phycisphaerales bacterium]|nr:ABC transporter permease [Phycisphaerales bacterium]
MASHPGRAAFNWRVFLEKYGAIFALIGLFVGTAVLEHLRFPADERAFLKPQNLLNIVSQWSFVGIVAVGMTFVIILDGIDLSVGSVVALAAGAGMYTMNAVAADHGSAWGILAGVGVCVAGGTVLGLINGLVIAKGRIAPFVATLGTMAIFRALVLAWAQGGEIRSSVSYTAAESFKFTSIGGGSFKLPTWLGGSPATTIPDGSEVSAVQLVLRYPVLVFAGVAILGHLLLSKTAFGLSVYSIGDNRRAARYAGVKIATVTTLVYTIAGLCCGVSALLNSSRLNSVSSSSLGLFYELDAIAAVVIGGTRLQGGAGRILGTVVGVLILGVVSNMLNMLQVSNFYHGLVKGIIIIAAVLVQPRNSEA